MNTVPEKMKSCQVDGLDYETGNLRELVKLCKVLQEQMGPDPFYLSARTAGEIVGVEPMTANRWLWLLERDGWITTIERGNVHGKATRYRFTGRRREGPAPSTGPGGRG